MVGELRHAELRDSLNRLVQLIPPPKPAAWQQWIIDRLSALPGRTPTEVRWSRRKVKLLRGELTRLSTYDVVQVEHAGLAPLLTASPAGRRVITLHNLMSVRLRQLSEVPGKRRVRWLLRRDALRAVRLESWVATHSDTIVVVSEEDAASLNEGNVVVVPNGVDLERFRLTPIPGDPRLIFTGTFSYGPNIDAAKWFSTEVFPLVRSQLPDAELVLVGREPHPEVLALTRLEGVTGFFDVPSVAPHLRSARVSLAPLRAGSGTRLKALEAMAAGRPVAGTAIGVEGLGLEDWRSAMIADDAGALAQRIIRLCIDDGCAAQMAEAARRIAEDRFSWDAVAETYLQRALGISERSTGT